MNNLTFGQAVEALKQGKRVTRSGWNGRGMYLWLLPAAMVKAEWCCEPHLKAVAEANGGEIEALGSIRMMTADKKVLTGWLASQTDMLSDDWIILDEVEQSPATPFVINGSTAPKPQMTDKPGRYVAVVKTSDWDRGELANMRMEFGVDYYKMTEDGRGWCYVFPVGREQDSDEFAAALRKVPGDKYPPCKYLVRTSDQPFPSVDPNKPTPMPQPDVVGVLPQAAEIFGITEDSPLFTQWPPLTAVKNENPEANK